MDAPLLICPNCRQALIKVDRTWRCPTGHSFDVAREGYVNLLVGQAPKGLAGDSAEMVAARRRWLGRGHYEFLARAVAEAVGPAQAVADFGCGEGYYLGQVLESSGAAGFGSDISKAAVAAAAKAYPAATWAVADTNKLIPLADESVDAGICVFAPRNVSEFARVIRPGGRLVVVIPGAGHLADLRERFGLIGIEEDKASKIAAQFEGRFKLENKDEIEANAEVDGAALTDLIEMTPNARHLDEATRAAMAGGGKANFRFEILTFTRILNSNEVSKI